MLSCRIRKIVFISVMIVVFSGYGELFAQGKFTPTEYVVGKIYLNGNKAFRTRKLKKQMNLKDKQLTRSKTFTRRLIELDRILLQTIYVKNGYLNSVVRDSFQVHENGKVDLYYFITEGRQYLLEQINIDGNTSLPDDDILEILDHRPDKPYNPIKIREGIKLLKTEYANNGKPLASIRDSLDVNSGIHLFIQIIENPTMKIGTIKIVNNKLVKNRPIEREILLKPGDLYSQKKIDMSKKHIFETGLFSSVNIRFSEIDTAKHILNLLVDIRELDMRYLGGSVGFGQEKGIAEGSDEYTSFSLDGEWLHRNIAGRGSRLSFNMGLSANFTNIFSRPATSASITYIEPWLFGFRSSTSFQLFYVNEIVSNKPQTKYGQKTALIYQPDRRFYASVGVVLQKVFWTDATGIQEVDTTTKDNERAFTFQVRRDYRDNFLFPTKGTVYTFDGKIVGTILGGTQDYYWLETSFSQYFPLWKRVVFAYRGKTGYQKPLGAKGTPGYAKFYLGGGSSLRGWRHNDFITDGKNVKILTNVEIRFPLFWILGGEVFIDGGNLASDIPSLLKQTYRWDAGFGLTIATPLGPIRIDIAKILGKKDRPYQWQFSIPYAF